MWLFTAGKIIQQGARKTTSNKRALVSMFFKLNPPSTMKQLDQFALIVGNDHLDRFHVICQYLDDFSKQSVQTCFLNGRNGNSIGVERGIYVRWIIK